MPTPADAMPGRGFGRRLVSCRRPGRDYPCAHGIAPPRCSLCGGHAAPGAGTHAHRSRDARPRRRRDDGGVHGRARGVARTVAVPRLGAARAAVGRASGRAIACGQSLAQSKDAARVARQVSHYRGCRRLRFPRLPRSTTRRRTLTPARSRGLSVGVPTAACDSCDWTLLRRG